MTEAGKKNIRPHPALIGFLILAPTFQTTLWPQVLQNTIGTPQLIFPVLLYFSLRAPLISACAVFYAIALAAAAWTFVPFIHLFTALLLLYILTSFSRDFYHHWRKFRFFFVFCCLWAVCLPLVLSLLSHLFSPRADFPIPEISDLAINALLTALWGGALFPLLNQIKIGSS